VTPSKAGILQKLKFSGDLPKIEHKWQHIKAEREELQECVRSHLRHAPLIQLSTTVLLVSPDQLQAEAQILFDAGRQACECQPPPGHQLNVLLEDRLAADPREEQRTASATQYRYVCSLNDHQPQHWRDGSETKVLEEKVLTPL